MATEICSNNQKSTLNGVLLTKTKMSENSDKPYWVYDKKTGKIKGFDKWKNAVKYDKLLNQNKDELQKR